LPIFVVVHWTSEYFKVGTLVNASRPISFYSQSNNMVGLT